MKKDYFGSYMGIVLQNDDIEHRGRVKVYVPHVSVTVYKDWHSDKVDKSFKFPDKDTNGDLIKIMEPLKEVLPWAECAMPLFGGNAPARYNAYTEGGTTSDSNYWEKGQAPVTTSQLEDGNRSLQNFVGETNNYADAFSETGKNDNKFVNEYAHQYTPSNYSNLARGLFSIPNVGSHVWVFFAEGNPNLPVYFAASHGREDWNRIYSMSQTDEDFTSVDYPGSYENISNAERDKQETDNRVFRAKTVFNSNKHSIELVDTDNREILKMTHFSGSFKEFTNYANIELASGNDQKMVVGDQFYTVQKNQSIYVGNSQEVIVVGDRYKTVGPKEYDTAKKIKDILTSIHEYKRLFDGKRADKATPGEVSRYQDRDGTFAICPVCQNLPYAPKPEWIIQPETIMDPIPTRELLTTGEKWNAYVGQVGYFLGSACAVCNPRDQGIKGGQGDLPDHVGFSPSTQDGEWADETLKSTVMTKLIEDQSDALMQLQRDLGEGDEISVIAKNKSENVGLVMNDLKSFRVDPIGKLRIDGVNVALEGVYPTFKTSPHVEYVDVDDVPGGDYNLTCGNKYKLLVGAKGINIKTFGPMDMYGTIVNLVGQQVNISSQNEVLIDGGERFSIRARKISLIPVEHQPVVIDGQLHVTRNAVVGGGMFVEGEMGVLHTTTPYEFKDTEAGLDGTSEAWTGLTPVDEVIVNPEVWKAISHSHIIPPHTHKYKHSAVTFLPAKEAVRDAMRTQGEVDG